MTTLNPELEQRCTVLRKELKDWEKQFATENDGRKASREDIKANTIISQKYKEYNKSRDILSGKAAPQTPSKPSRKRKIAEEESRAPATRPSDPTRTPSKKICIDATVSPSQFGSASKILSPQGPAVIGPTPQRDGIVLGLFDLLPAETPSKASRTILGEVVPNLLQTPSKNRGKPEEEGSIETRARGSRTPLSAGKRFLLDKFVTPKKRKRDDEEGTPTSAMKHLSTPAFLRRDNPLDIINEENEPTPRPAPWKRRGLGRSLSAMIASMKKQEEERLDGELDIMREMEMEAEGIPVPKKSQRPEILVEDSQAPMRLGPDGAGNSQDEDKSSAAEDGLDKNGKPRKVWKKRGQKRQTKRVIMRPVIHKPKPQPIAQELEDDSDNTETIQETQIAPIEVGGDGASEDDASDYSDASHTSKPRKTSLAKFEEASSKSKTGPIVTKEEGGVKKAARKVKESAHANYRKLKIKSKNGKGGKGHFGRRR